MCVILPFRRLGLLLLVVLAIVSSRVSEAFVAPLTLGRSVTPERPDLVAKPEEGITTSLNVGQVYGPQPSHLVVGDENHLSILQRRTSVSGNNRFILESRAFAEDEVADSQVFGRIAISIAARDARAEVTRRKWKKVVAASAAVVAATAMAQQLTAALAVGGGPLYLLSKIPYFYKAFPMQASIATASLNSLLADTIAQVQTWKPKQGVFGYEWRQQVSSLTYGALVVGIGSNLMYTKLLPALFPASAGVKSIISSALLDNFVCAPFLWLPPAYIIKALFLGQPVMSYLKKYVDSIRKEKLLLRYWSVWIPAQLFTFSVVPKHLRMLSTAVFGFLWFLILTKMTANKQEA